MKKDKILEKVYLQMDRFLSPKTDILKNLGNTYKVGIEKLRCVEDLSSYSIKDLTIVASVIYNIEDNLDDILKIDLDPCVLEKMNECGNDFGEKGVFLGFLNDRFAASFIVANETECVETRNSLNDAAKMELNSFLDNYSREDFKMELNAYVDEAMKDVRW